MNYLVIFILIAIILLSWYVLYTYFISNVTTLATLVNLTNPNAPITGTNIQTPNTVHYSIGVWIYVNSWGTGTKNIFSIIDMGSQKTLFDLVLGSTNLTLSADISVAGTLQNTIITNNFPVQKWVYVTISVDGSILDAYLDGKLVLSTILKDARGNTMNSDVSNTPQINFGNGYDIYLSKFQRWTTASDPQTVWSNYYAGNGQNNSLTGSVGANLNITSNNIPQRSIKLF
jgi:hypothetical protein